MRKCTSYVSAHLCVYKNIYVYTYGSVSHKLKSWSTASIGRSSTLRINAHKYVESCMYVCMYGSVSHKHKSWSTANIGRSSSPLGCMTQESEN